MGVSGFILPVTVNKLLILPTYIDVYLLYTVTICLQLIPLSQDYSFFMIGSLKVMHQKIFTIPSVIHFSSISSIRLNSINLRKLQLKLVHYEAQTVRKWEMGNRHSSEISSLIHTYF